MQPVIIVGNAITAEILYAFIKDDKRYSVAAFTVNRDSIKEKRCCGIDVIPLEELAQTYDNTKYKVLMAIGYNNLNQNREQLYNQVQSLGFDLITYIHPDAKVFSHNIGNGCLILPDALIEPYAKIGNSCVIWSNCTIAHHVSIEDNCWIASGSVIAGNSGIQRNSFLGVNATVANEVSVGAYNIIGANSLIAKNTKANEVHLAKSAERIRFSSQDYAKFYKL